MEATKDNLKIYGFKLSKPEGSWVKEMSAKKYGFVIKRVELLYDAERLVFSLRITDEFYKKDFKDFKSEMQVLPLMISNKNELFAIMRVLTINQ